MKKIVIGLAALVAVDTALVFVYREYKALVKELEAKDLENSKVTMDVYLATKDAFDRDVLK